jgi:hypothetical protein
VSAQCLPLLKPWVLKFACPNTKKTHFSMNDVFLFEVAWNRLFLKWTCMNACIIYMYIIYIKI